MTRALLVDALLTLSRVEAGVLGKRAEPVQVAAPVHEVVDDAKFAAGAVSRDVRWRVDVGGLDHAVVMRRAEFLQRAFENIVLNAVKHTPEGGTVEIMGRMESGGRIRALNRERRGLSIELALPLG